MTYEQPSEVDATFYVQIEPEWTSWRQDADGEQILSGAKAARITQSKPGRPKPGTVTAKLTLRLPASAFLPLRPHAIVTVPADAVSTTPLEVVVGDAEETTP